MYKKERIRKHTNILFGATLIVLLLFSGIHVPNIYTEPSGTLVLNIPIIIAFIIIFSVFICFNLTFKIKKEQSTKIEGIEREEEQNTGK